MKTSLNTNIDNLYIDAFYKADGKIFSVGEEGKPHTMYIKGNPYVFGSVGHVKACLKRALKGKNENMFPNIVYIKKNKKEDKESDAKGQGSIVNLQMLENANNFLFGCMNALKDEDVKKLVISDSLKKFDYERIVTVAPILPVNEQSSNSQRGDFSGTRDDRWRIENVQPVLTQDGKDVMAEFPDTGVIIFIRDTTIDKVTKQDLVPMSIFGENKKVAQGLYRTTFTIDLKKTRERLKIFESEYYADKEIQFDIDTLIKNLIESITDLKFESNGGDITTKLGYAVYTDANNKADVIYPDINTSKNCITECEENEIAYFLSQGMNEYVSNNKGVFKFKEKFINYTTKLLFEDDK